jgi:uncharacterized protein YjbI with pentapeptide repeats
VTAGSTVFETQAQLYRADVPATLTGDKYPRALLDEVHTRLPRVRASSATLDNARLDRVRATGGDFTHASLRGASLRSADLTDADFTGADLTGADLTASLLDGARFHAARWDGTTRWPEGFDTPVA